MVQEYLESILKTIKEQIKEYQAQSKEKLGEKEIIDKKISKIQAKEELDVEFFSPRVGEKSLRGQLEELYNELNELKEKIREIEEKVEGLNREKEQFEMMLDEVIDLKVRANVSRETKNI